MRIPPRRQRPPERNTYRNGRSAPELIPAAGRIVGTPRSPCVSIPASGCRASCETGLAATYLRAVTRDRGRRPEVRQSWPTRYACRPHKVPPRGGPRSFRARCAGSDRSTTRWCPMAAMLAATSGGIAGIPGHAPNAGPQPGARHAPPGLPPGVAPSQPRYPAPAAGPPSPPSASTLDGAPERHLPGAGRPSPAASQWCGGSSTWILLAIQWLPSGWPALRSENEGDQHFC
jgi:hypothetical protein